MKSMTFAGRTAPANETGRADNPWLAGPIQRVRLGVLMGAVLLLALSGQAVERVALVDKGAARAVLVLPPQPAPAETLAAKEIVDHVALPAGFPAKGLKIGSTEQGKLKSEVTPTGLLVRLPLKTVDVLTIEPPARKGFFR